MEELNKLVKESYIKGLQDAVDIAYMAIDELWDDCEQRSGAHTVRLKLEEALRKLQNENS
jgi:hypothetical protein